MKTGKNNYDKYYSELAQNRQKGELYVLKLRGNPVKYTVIPYIKSENIGNPIFTYKVLFPEHAQGMYQEPVKEIESLAKSSEH